MLSKTFGSSQEEHSSISVRFNRTDRIYRPGDKLSGVIVVNSFKGWNYHFIKITTQGTVELLFASKLAGMIDVVTVSKPQVILSRDVVVLPAGKFDDGVYEFPFDFVVNPIDKKSLYESYHGAYVSVSYFVNVIIDRGLLKQVLTKESEYLVEIPTKPRPISTIPSPEFCINRSKLSDVPESTKSSMKDFEIVGKLHSSCFSATQPFTGELKVVHCETPIASISLQLLRVESVITDVNTYREGTEIQVIQIVEGDPCRNLIIPLYFVFPRLFCCSTIRSPTFCVEFEVNLIVLFEDGVQITENFPIVLFRE